MSMVTVHGPNTMYTTQAGGQAIASSPAGATATKSPTNGLVYSFSFPNPGARPATDFDWTFTGPGSPAAQADRYSGTVTYSGAGAGTIVCTVAAGAGPPAAGAYTITTAPTAGVPRDVPEEEPPSEEPSPEGHVDVAFDPAAHTIEEVMEFVQANPDQAKEMLDAEVAGKNRVTLVTQLQEIAFDPGDYTVTQVIGYVEDHPDKLEEVIAAEQAGKNRTTLIAQLEGMRPA